MTADGTWHLSHHLGLPIAIFIGDPSAMVRAVPPTQGCRFVASIGINGFESVAPVATLADVVEHLRSTGEPVELTPDARAHLLGNAPAAPEALVFTSDAPDKWENRRTALMLFAAALTLLPYVYLFAAAFKWGIR